MKKIIMVLLVVLISACGVRNYKQESSEDSAILDFQYLSHTALGSVAFISHVADNNQSCTNDERVATFSVGNPLVPTKNTRGNKFKPGLVKLIVNVGPNGMPYTGVGCLLYVSFNARPKEKLTMRIEYTQHNDQCNVTLFRNTASALSQVDMNVSKSCH